MEPTKLKYKPIICIDFDGVIHAYRDGWKDGQIYDDVVPGFFIWASRAKEHFKLVIYSSRSKTPEGMAAMAAWLDERMERGGVLREHLAMADFTFAHEKPPAFLTIDDRAICFDGNWMARHLDAEVLLGFRTWTQAPSARPFRHLRFDGTDAMPSGSQRMDIIAEIYREACLRLQDRIKAETGIQDVLDMADDVARNNAVLQKIMTP